MVTPWTGVVSAEKEGGSVIYVDYIIKLLLREAISKKNGFTCRSYTTRMTETFRTMTRLIMAITLLCFAAVVREKPLDIHCTVGSSDERCALTSQERISYFD